MVKYLITGGSGFIGTNLISYLLRDEKAEILNIDAKTPKISSHRNCWKQIDIRDRQTLIETIIDFQPNIVIHLAARTDLSGKTLDDYNSNIEGVSNLLDALEQVKNVRKVIFASSMYVCKPGYTPKHCDEYAPHTLYGESKAETEKIIKNRNPNYTWSIIRPTSIWGPWFEEPYDTFFRIILSRFYFHLGKRACKKTYGYIDNAIYQIMSIAQAEADKINKKVFYIGDYEPYNITQWANEIASFENIRIPTVPFFLFSVAAWVGDFLRLLGITFPMTSFRLKNMTTDNIHDLSLIKEIAPNLPVLRKDGIKTTLQWMKKKNNN
ncbi:MAG: NAD(P)-dependent oxidoreductase [Tannerellaceae bacterium]|jgi:nucleoside-diphosphate-sugar epimerase|nr:NAD(P)-dependent oxidoreductase [Tannerellaceae bacterium]